MKKTLSYKFPLFYKLDNNIFIETVRFAVRLSLYPIIYTDGSRMDIAAFTVFLEASLLKILK